MYINSLNKTNYIKNVDTGSSIHLTVSDYDESLVDLTSYDSVEVIIGDDTGRLREINPTLESDTGELSFDFTEDDLLPEGEYYLEVHLIESDGSTRVAPSERKFYMHVTKSLDEVGDTVNVITIQEFEQRIQDAETTANDAADYANEQGDYAKAEADRLEGTDVSQLDNRLTSHEDNTNNPHSVTKSQVGLGNVENVQQASQSDFDDLVARIGNNDDLNTDEKSKIILALNEVNNKADDNASDLTEHKADDVTDGGAHGLEIEEGAWTPLIEGTSGTNNHTYTKQEGEYCKIGKMVFISFNIEVDTFDEGSSATMTLSGLPFPTIESDVRSGATISRYKGIDIGSHKQIGLSYSNSGGTGYLVFYSSSDSSSGSISMGDTTSNFIIWGSMSYQTG